MHRCLLRSARPLALCLLLACACDDAKTDATPDAKPGADGKTESADGKTASADAKSEPEADAKPTDGKRDRGSMTAQIGGVAWTGQCSAKPKDEPDTMGLSCSTMSTENGVTKRDSLQLTISGYTGKGDYTARSGTFTRVAVDTAAATAAFAPGEDGKEPSEAKQVGVLAKSIDDAGVFPLAGAKVSITSVSDTALEGTIAWTPDAENGITIEQATFRAVIKPKK